MSPQPGTGEAVIRERRVDLTGTAAANPAALIDCEAGPQCSCQAELQERIRALEAELIQVEELRKNTIRAWGEDQRYRMKAEARVRELEAERA